MSPPAYQPGNCLICGSTGCGKSTAEEQAIVAAADDEDKAIVVEDPHEKALANSSFKHLSARGHEPRILIDRLWDSHHPLSFSFLPPSLANDPLQRRQENEQTVWQFLDVLSRRRDLGSLAKAPQTEEWAFKAGMLIVSQCSERPADEMRFALRPKHRTFHSLMNNCTEQDIVDEFRDIAKGVVKPGTYVAAKRIIDGVCGSVPFRLRCGGRFNLRRFLDNRGILLIEGGARGISEDTARTILGCINLQVLQYIRRRWCERPRVLHVLDEANNAGLIGAAGHETRALAEFRKAGYDCHILVQSLNFPTTQITNDVLTNTIEHHWFFNANDAVCRAAAADLGDPEFRRGIRELRRGERYIKRLRHVTFDRVVPLPDPWVYPEISDLMAREALSRIYERPEYEDPKWLTSHYQETSSGNSESSTSPPSTSASSDTSSPSSPAARLRTAKSLRSKKQSNSDTSAP